VDRRLFLRSCAVGASLPVLAPVLAACAKNSGPKAASSPDPTPTGTQQCVISPRTPLSEVGGCAAGALTIGDAEAETVVGDRRYAFGLLTADKSRVLGADVTVYAGFDETKPPLHTVKAKPLVEGTAKLGLYVATLPFTKAGNMLVAVVAKTREEGALLAGGTTVVVHSTSPSPMPGQPAISVPTATLSNPRHANPICSRKPACTMHSAFLPDALTSGKPTVLTFAAPAYCVTETCGPVVDLVEAQHLRHGAAMNFIHVEAYIQPNSQLAAPLEAWKFDGEPWTYFIDSHGIVSSRLSGAFGGEEIAAAIAKLR
jgi:hypothetical protein